MMGFDISMQWTLVLYAHLAVGGALAASFWWRRRPSRAHWALVCGTSAAALIVGVGLMVSWAGWGQLASATPTSPPPSVGSTSTAPGSTALSLSNTVPAAADSTVMGPSSGPARAGVRETSVTVADAGSDLSWWGAVLTLLALAIWGLMSVAVLAWKVRSWHLGRRLSLSGQPARDPTLQSCLRRVTVEFGLKREVTLYELDCITSPMVWCFSRRVRLMVPASRPGGLNWTPIFRHECEPRWHPPGRTNPGVAAAARRRGRNGGRRHDDATPADPQPARATRRRRRAAGPARRPWRTTRCVDVERTRNLDRSLSRTRRSQPGGPTP